MQKKLTPSKRLKELKNNGWLEFVEFMETLELTPRDLQGDDNISRFRARKSASWLAEDIGYDMYKKLISANMPEMIGLSKMLKTSTKSNKMVKRGLYR